MTDTAAVGAKLSESERRELFDLLSRHRNGECGDGTVYGYVESLLASARAAGMEEAAKIFDEMADQAENDSYHFLYRSKAAAIRAAIGATDGTEPR
jgi:hypothetical protein